MNWARHCKAVENGKSGFPIVEVVWYDAVDLGTDWVINAPCELRLSTTVGYLVKETKKSVTVVSIINSEHFAHGVVIPKQDAKMRILS